MDFRDPASRFFLLVTCPRNRKEENTIQAKDLLLYAITNRKTDNPDSFLKEVEEAILGGATMIQLREKNASEENFLRYARLLKPLCDRYRIPLIINDKAKIAKAVDASGVHLGESDGEIREARKLLGPDKIIGATAKSVEYALACQEAGADYLGSGDIFGTGSKTGAKRMDMDTLKAICRSVSIPVVAIGGINRDNLPLLKDSGIAGVSVIGGIFGSGDIEENARILRFELDNWSF